MAEPEQPPNEADLGIIKFDDGRIYIRDTSPGFGRRKPRISTHALPAGVEVVSVLPDGRVLVKASEIKGRHYAILPDKYLRAATQDEENDVFFTKAAKVAGIGKGVPGKTATEYALDAAPGIAAYAVSGGLPLAKAALPETAGVLPRIMSNLGRALKIGGTSEAVGTAANVGHQVMNEKPVNVGQAAAEAAPEALGWTGLEASMPLVGATLNKVRSLAADVYPLSKRSIGKSLQQPLNTELLRALDMEGGGIEATRADLSNDPALQRLSGGVSKMIPGARASGEFRQRQHEQLRAFLDETLGPLRQKVGARESERGSIGKALQEEIRGAQGKEKDLYLKALSEFEARGGTVDASSLIDHVEGELGPGEEAAQFFERLGPKFRAQKGSVGKLIPKFSVAEMNAPIRAENAVIKQANDKLAVTNRRNAARIKQATGLDVNTLDMANVSPAQKQILDKIGIPLPQPPSPLKPLLSSEDAYQQWREGVVETLKNTPPTVLENVRQLLGEEARTTNKGTVKLAAMRANQEIDRIISDPEIEAGRSHYSKAMAMGDKDRQYGLANILSKPPEDAAELITHKNESELVQMMKLAKEYKSPRAAATVQLAYLGKAVENSKFANQPDFYGMKSKLGLTDDAVKDILRSDYASPHIPDHLKEIFTKDADGRQVLRRLAMVSELGSRIKEFNPSGTSYVLQAQHDIRELGTAVTDVGKMGALFKMGARIGTTVGLARLLFSDAGTNWLMQGMVGEQKAARSRLHWFLDRATKPSLRERALTARGVSRSAEALYAAYNATEAIFSKYEDEQANEKQKAAGGQ